MTLYQKYRTEPRKALQELFKLEGDCLSYMSKTRSAVLFLWQGGKCKDGINYGAYKYVHQDELEQRSYDVVWADYRPSVRYTDVLFDPKSGRYYDANSVKEECTNE